MRWMMRLALALFCIYFVPRFCHEKTDGFTVLRIQSKLPKSENPSAPFPHLTNICTQEFKFLGSGGQVYAFVSADNQYVLKFLKHDRHFLPFWRSIVPRSIEKREKKKRKRLKDLASYRLCMKMLPEETGLLYLHLDETDHLKTCVSITDKLHITHRIDLDTTAFIVQKRAMLAYDHLEALIEREKFSEAKEALTSICQLVLSRCRKGIFDEDCRIHRNIGFIEGRAIAIDVGRLKLDPRRLDPNTQREDLRKTTARLKQYLQTRCPPLADFLENYVENHPL